MLLALVLFHFISAKQLSELKQIWIYLAPCIEPMILGNQDLSVLLLVNFGEWLNWDIPYKRFPPVIQILPIVKTKYSLPSLHTGHWKESTHRSRSFDDVPHPGQYWLLQCCVLTKAINPASHDKWPQEKSLCLFRMLIPISVSNCFWHPLVRVTTITSELVEQPVQDPSSASLQSQLSELAKSSTVSWADLFQLSHDPV